MRRNLRGFYGAFSHDRQSDWDFLAAWQPSVVRVMLPGSYPDPASISPDKVQRIHDLAPDALILLRCWSADDHNGDRHREMDADPINFAIRQVDFWATVVDRIPGVPRDKLMAGLNNEVNPVAYGPALRDYTDVAMERARGKELRLGVGMFSVGTPGKPGELPYDMNYFASWEQTIIEGNHTLILHEYMQPEGMYAVWTDNEGRERHDFTNLINRHTHWPINVPMIIGEGGIDGILFDRHRHPEYGHNGWQNFAAWPPARFADEYVERCGVASPNVLALCDFIWDAGDHTWDSFDPLPAAAELLERKNACEIETNEKPPDVHIPIATKPPMQPPDPPVCDHFDKALAFILKQEGGWSDNPADPGGATMKGITFTTFRNWRQAHGEPIPSKDDLRNISDEEAAQIYREWYWLASGADTMPWPLALAQFDLAVNGGVGRAKQALQEAGPDFLRQIAWRMDWYTRIAGWQTFGAGWIRRVAALLREAA